MLVNDVISLIWLLKRTDLHLQPWEGLSSPTRKNSTQHSAHAQLKEISKAGVSWDTVGGWCPHGREKPAASAQRPVTRSIRSMLHSIRIRSTQPPSEVSKDGPMGRRTVRLAPPRRPPIAPGGEKPAAGARARPHSVAAGNQDCTVVDDTRHYATMSLLGMPG